MHNDFADWYRRVDIAPKSEVLQKRWQAIVKFCREASVSDLEDATRFFFGLPPRDEQFLARFRAEFKATDDMFPMRDNDAELQVLAGASLAGHFKFVDEWGILSVVIILCGASEGWRKPPVPDIVQLARRTLREQSLSLRAPQPKVPIPALDVKEKVQNLNSILGNGGGNFQSLQGPLLDVLQPLLTTVEAFANSSKKAMQLEELRQEESDVLWWLFGESSRDLGVPFKELKAPSACLIGSKEIADLTRVLPGPYGVEAFLYKMLSLAHPSLTGTVSLSDAVSACPEEWQKQFVAFKGLDTIIDLCPVHLAVQKCLEAGCKKNVWHVPFQTMSGLKATTKINPASLALQTYRERLLIRVLSQWQEPVDE